MQYKKLYVILLLALMLLVLFSLGKGFWGDSGVVGSHWTENLFYGVCHQIPERTFTINGNLMAINTRCFGIFTGLFAGWLLIPVFKNRVQNNRIIIYILAFAVILQIIDYTGNLMLWWENTNISRALLGGILGVAASVSIAGMFQSSKINL